VIGNRDLLLNQRCDGVVWFRRATGFRLGFAFWGHTPGVLAKSEKVVWIDWDAGMGKNKSVEGDDLEEVAAERKCELRGDSGGGESRVAG
jgi:hypothetical protein